MLSPAKPQPSNYPFPSFPGGVSQTGLTDCVCVSRSFVNQAAFACRPEYNMITEDPIQRLRDRCFEKRATTTEVFRGFDADRDG